MANPKKLLLLGAGASFGSETNKSIVPPLAADLFDELARFEPGVWSQIPSEIQTAFKLDFESGVIKLAEANPHALPVIQRSMAAFFFRYGITRSSLYVRLADKLLKAKWAGAIATLNYERMLLMALGAVGISSTCGSADIQWPQLEVSLPHGCCHLFCESVHGSSNAVSFHGMNVSTDGPVIAIDQSLGFWNRIRSDAFPPVMSYFEPGKYTTSGASFIRNQRNRLRDLITMADAIAIVGLQVREQDGHIWDPLAATSAAIYYCSGERGASLFKDWQSRKHATSGTKDIISMGTWNDDFDRICNHLEIVSGN